MESKFHSLLRNNWVVQVIELIKSIEQESNDLAKYDRPKELTQLRVGR